MNKEDNHNLSELTAYLREEIPKINENLNKIERAIYGDPINKVNGLIDYNKQTQHQMQKIDARFEKKIADFEKVVDENVTEIRERISVVETFKKQLKWIATGLVTGASIGGAGIWELLSKIK